MHNKEIATKAAKSAVVSVAYVAAVAFLFSNAPKIFAGHDPGPGFLAPLSFLLLFVLSTAVMGLLIFGTPLMWYIDGKKREAVSLLVWTVGFLALETIVLITMIAIRSRIS